MGGVLWSVLDHVCHSPNVKSSCGCRMLLQCLELLAAASPAHGGLQLDASVCLCARAGSFLPWGMARDAPGQVGEEERVGAGNVAPSWLPTCCGKHGLNRAQPVS